MKISTKILPDPIVDKIRKNRTLYKVLRRALEISRLCTPKIRHEGLPYRIHPNDFMLDSYSKEGLEEYKESGIWLNDLLKNVLSEQNKCLDDDTKFLEFGCGYGRHTRWLVGLMSPENVTVADVTKSAVKFCISEFGVKGVVSEPDVNWRQYGTYDVIYSFSVLTHLSEKRIDNYLRVLQNCLVPSGLGLFTMHGPSTIESAGNVHSYLNVSQIRSEVEQNGIYFKPYPHIADSGLGDTFMSEEFLQKKMEKICPQVQLVWYRSVNEKQDIWLVRKNS